MSIFDVIRQRVSEASTWLNSSMTAKVGLGLILLSFLAFLFPKVATKDYEYEEGSIWNDEDLIAPYPFPIYRDESIVEVEQDSARAATPPSFDRIDTIQNTVIDSSRTLLRKYAGIIDALVKRNELRIGESLPNRYVDTLNDQAISRSIPVLKNDGWKQLIRIRQNERGSGGIPLQPLYSELRSIVNDIYKIGILEKNKDWFQQHRIAVIEGGLERLQPLSSFFDKNDIALYLAERYEDESDAEWGQLVATIAFSVLTPNIVLNPDNTSIAIQNAINRVPRTEGIVKKNERIVGRHERITGEIESKIDSYLRAKAERTGDVNEYLQTLGKVTHTLAILSLLIIYLFQFRKRLYKSNADLLLISILIAFQAFLAYLTTAFELPSSAQYLILVPASAMLLTIIYDSRVAFYTTVVISLLVGAIRGNDYSIILASILAGSLALYTVRDIKHRTQIFRSLAFIFLGYGLAIATSGLQRSIPIMDVSIDLAYAFGNAIISPVITFGLLVFFEKVFNITTDLTLLELSDFNHPLLRDLSTKAPGTFHHSIVMGTLAEAAATNIGGNAILARVGAYYHDIGKSVEPGYFVENQAAGSNPHDELPPQSSANKIIDHVLIGIKLAEEYKLPDRVIDFIPGHHGTTLVSYFFEKAKKENPDVTEEEFRYKGPKPNSKETGIVMLADTIEAASRTIEDPSAEKFENLIDSVINQRLTDGQLDNCDLTLRDLSEVKRSFLTVLLGIHHNRIKYPSKDAELEAKKKLEQADTMLNFPSGAESLSKRIKKLKSLLE
ncbi:MAG: hydrolase [Ectothiorhodospiraceae bacterium]|nr:hydrolase [Ectothiorhodospiraceae bacterium]